MKRNKWVVLLVLLIIAGFVGYNYLYKDHRDISTEEASFSIGVATLDKDFKENEASANAKYLDQTITVSGKISEIDLEANALVVDGTLFAVFSEPIATDLKKDENVKIKGRFIGYDELLEEFKMDQCTIVKD
ncbi:MULTISPECIES: OB-fold putative lipoprotein [Flavobacterium]|uniref:OB-fold putative lipoprotein n=1 Tax=Flavobacterium jumunjinense TaxID=998845 RepID=A0ABV5GN51_9FLAO|nr:MULTISPECIES: OB-fold putative lipoprotein [Flavobacterium]